MLCEILQVDLDDYRLVQARESALEMVADSEASETAGFSWALTVSLKITRLLLIANLASTYRTDILCPSRSPPSTPARRPPALA